MKKKKIISVVQYNERLVPRYTGRAPPDPSQLAAVYAAGTLHTFSNNNWNTIIVQNFVKKKS